MTESVSGSPAAQALVDAAEHRFAADGINAASLRAIMREAGTDPGAIHYHFGSREDLAAAVLDRVLVPLNERRLRGLASLEAEDFSLPDLCRVLIGPDVEVAMSMESRGSGNARLLGAIYLHPERFVTRLVEQRFEPVAARFFPRLARMVPHVPGPVLAWRVRWGVFGMLGAVLASTDGAIRRDRHRLLARLVDAAVGVLATPAQDEDGA